MDIISLLTLDGRDTVGPTHEAKSDKCEQDWDRGQSPANDDCHLI